LKNLLIIGAKNDSTTPLEIPSPLVNSLIMNKQKREGVYSGNRAFICRQTIALQELFQNG